MTSGVKMLSSAGGLGRHFEALGHRFHHTDLPNNICLGHEILFNVSEMFPVQSNLFKDVGAQIVSMERQGKKVSSSVTQALYVNSNHRLVSAKPASCESDKDCLKGKAKCVRRKCHCISTFGDGKSKCNSKYKIFRAISFLLFSV